MSQVTTISFCRYPNFKAIHWALSQMEYAKKPLRATAGLRCFKLMGCGRGEGFNPWPDWSAYCVLLVWDNEDAASRFFESSPLWAEFQERTSEIWTFWMGCLRAKGAWSGGNPFEMIDERAATEHTAVITRATIKLSKLAKFWKYVPESQRRLSDSPGLLFSAGIGEIPIIQMATFSVWNTAEAMKAYAYGNPEHKKAIEMTRSLGWYKEELFSRFAVLKSEGSWNGNSLV
ncbi:MAG: DUF3291 domain-containing protein [Opitutales bacterium]